MLKNKKLVIISSLALLIVVAVVTVWIVKQKPENGQPIVSQPAPYVPTFLDDAEKAQIGLPAETKIQVLEKTVDGQVMVYKVINDDADIVTDPSAISPISPRRQ